MLLAGRFIPQGVRGRGGGRRRMADCVFRGLAMYPIAKGLPNNRILHVLGRAYAAPGEEPPVLWRGQGWLWPVAVAAGVIGLAQGLAVLL